MRKILFPLLIIFVMTGCVKQQLYTWEKYPFSLYKYKKEPTDENLQKHKEMLLTIIKNSNEKNLRVPPGVYCECGFLLLKEGKKEEAFTYFDLEEKTYPESAVFIQNLRSFVNKANNQDKKDISTVDNKSSGDKKKEGL